jgi:hypothetical protein
MWSLSAFQNIYTPHTAYVDTRAELGGDRPYSGVLGLSAGLEWVFDNGPFVTAPRTLRASHLGVEAMGATLGPWSFAGDMQYYAHNTHLRVSGKPWPPRPGWGKIETAPRLLAGIGAFAETTVLGGSVAAPGFLDFTGGEPGWVWRLGATADVGSWSTNGGVTSELLAGWLGDPLARRTTWIPVVGYLSLRSAARGVLYNATIDGALLDGPSPAESSPLVFDVQVGALLRVAWLELSLFNVYRSNEVRSLERELSSGQVIWRLAAAAVF